MTTTETLMLLAVLLSCLGLIVSVTVALRKGRNTDTAQAAQLASTLTELEAKVNQMPGLDTVQRLGAVEGKLLEIEQDLDALHGMPQRMAALEVAVAALPSTQHLHRLEVQLTQLAGTVEKFAEQSHGVDEKLAARLDALDNLLGRLERAVETQGAILADAGAKARARDGGA